MSTKQSLEQISVIVPRNPFTPSGIAAAHHFLCALDVEKLMAWWPGLPHVPHHDLKKVKAIQRSLDWKKVAKIAAYLLQEEIEDAPKVLDKFFGPIYEPRKNEPGREWPPKIKGIINFDRSSFPFFSNVLVHVNGAAFQENTKAKGTGELHLDPSAKDFYLSVIDGQHRVNGAFLALKIKQEKNPSEIWQVPAEVFLDLDPPGKPIRQAQIFIDVNFNQKKVDRSLVADLFPLARGNREPFDAKDRAQDIGRKLMLETGPLVGMIQIPGIKYGVKDVVTLATLNGAIERAIPSLDSCDITNLEAQTSFIAQVLDSWLEAAGRAEATGTSELSSQNVVYQGRVLVSIIDLVPAILARLRDRKIPFVSDKARKDVAVWLRQAIDRAGLLKQEQFVSRDEFKKLGFHGSGGIGRFRDRLWASGFRESKLGNLSSEKISEEASNARKKINEQLSCHED